MTNKREEIAEKICNLYHKHIENHGVPSDFYEFADWHLQELEKAIASARIEELKLFKSAFCAENNSKMIDEWADFRIKIITDNKLIGE